MAIAQRLDGQAGASLADKAAHAFTDAMALGLIGAAAVALVGIPLVLRHLPPRHRPARLEAVPPLPPAAVQDLAA
jgi:hypothetical protein